MGKHTVVGSFGLEKTAEIKSNQQIRKVSGLARSAFLPFPTADPAAGKASPRQRAWDDSTQDERCQEKAHPAQPREGLRQQRAPRSESICPHLHTRAPSTAGTARQQLSREGSGPLNADLSTCLTAFLKRDADAFKRKK